MKELVSRVLGVTFDFEVEETQFDGVLVEFDGVRAVIGSNSKPAKARAYMLLAKEISENKKSVSIRETANFDVCGVMLDMSFGSVSKVAGVKKYLDYMAIFGMNMLMLYTEDTYEVKEYPLFGYQRGRYTEKELKEIDDYAFSLGIEIIPCIQTFGHLGQFLRWKQHKDIAENDRVLLPGEEKTYEFIESCIKACKAAFRSPRIHIGCDETFGLGLGKSLRRDGLRDRMEVFNEHVLRVVEICKKYDYRPMMWSDMYSTLAKKITGADESMGLPQSVLDSIPDADMVFWNYYHKDHEFYREKLIRHAKFNREILFAGGIWTWNGQAPNFTFTYETASPALEECLDFGIRSVFGAAWAYGDINHIQALPSLAVYSEYCWRGKECTKEQIDSVAEFITGLSPELCAAISDFYCGEEGDINTGKLMLWGDPLIPLVPFGFDFDKIERYYENALKVFEKYPDAPYMDFYRVLFRCTLEKVRIHRDLHTKYKAGDKEFLRHFADVTLPPLVEDMKKLYEIHDAYWHEENKTHGWEKLGNAYAAAIARLIYTGREIEKYLDGKIDQIEALEPEVLEGVPTKLLRAPRVMSTYL